MHCSISTRFQRLNCLSWNTRCWIRCSHLWARQHAWEQMALLWRGSCPYFDSQRSKRRSWWLYVEEYNNVEENDLNSVEEPSCAKAYLEVSDFECACSTLTYWIQCSFSLLSSPSLAYPANHWPTGTSWGVYLLLRTRELITSPPAKALPNQKLQRYLRAFTSWHGVNANDNNPNISYNTRVEKSLNPRGKGVGWALTIKELIPTKHSTLRETSRKEVRGHILDVSFGC